MFANPICKVIMTRWQRILELLGYELAIPIKMNRLTYMMSTAVISIMGLVFDSKHASIASQVYDFEMFGEHN